ncbi:hypothetical protein B0H67DRAFT_213059 [Lasiosphaeris hirsuta]|uniref:Uncharacterized protein n=1 Tax=Lasiosphaeris hirsuta TaxID=260670 RepID=A0AA40ASD7_9PEZI|nr:hypothetical protein B0H67DRAFT_213059 [Lasiosphaeris hirsuta]
MTQKQPAKTYFLTPGWEIPSSSPLLGSIIANPSQPDIALFRPPAASLNASTTTSPSSSFNTSASTSSPGATGLFSTFLSVFGLGDEPALTYDRKHVLSYSFRGQRSIEFTPSPELLRGVAANELVAQLFANGLGVYMITGVKIISGAGVGVASAKGSGWAVELSVGNTQDGPGGDEKGGVIFALQVAEVKVQEGGEVVLRELDAEAGVLQGKLDGEFGEGTYKVFKGFDEAGGDTGEACLIVTSSPTCVDLFTAGTVKVGGEHGIWH